MIKSMVAEKFNNLEKVAIVDLNFGHMFELGTIVTLRKMKGYYRAECEDGKFWYVSDCEIKSLEVNNILGTDKDLLLYGSSGEIRYSFLEIGETVQEVYYDERGVATKYKAYKI